MADKTTLPMKRQDAAPQRWDPVELVEALQDEMDRFWRWSGPGLPLAFPSLLRRASRPAMAWAPRMDVYDKDNALIVKAEVPGLKKEDVQVELDDGDLVIRGERKAESETREEQYYRMERSVGSFYRRLPLPFEVQADQIQATMTDGVLEVRVNKPVELKPEPKKIPVA